MALLSTPTAVGLTPFLSPSAVESAGPIVALALVALLSVGYVLGALGGFERVRAALTLAAVPLLVAFAAAVALRVLEVI